MIYHQIIDHINRYVNLTPEEEVVVCSALQLINVKKKALITEPGKICKGEYFVLTGLLRQYYINKKLNEQIVQFALEGWWMTDHESLINNTSGTTYIQTVENSEILFLSSENKIILLQTVPKLEVYFRLMMQKAFIALQRRIGFLFNQTDEERFHNFSNAYPGFIQRIPQYMLASYLGFTPQFLSRIRARKK